MWVRPGRSVSWWQRRAVVMWPKPYLDVLSLILTLIISLHDIENQLKSIQQHWSYKFSYKNIEMINCLRRSTVATKLQCGKKTVICNLFAPSYLPNYSFIFVFPRNTCPNLTKFCEPIRNNTKYFINVFASEWYTKLFPVRLVLIKCFLLSSRWKV